MYWIVNIESGNWIFSINNEFNGLISVENLIKKFFYFIFPYLFHYHNSTNFRHSLHATLFRCRINALGMTRHFWERSTNLRKLSSQRGITTGTFSKCLWRNKSQLSAALRKSASTFWAISYFQLFYVCSFTDKFDSFDVNYIRFVNFN